MYHLEHVTCRKIIRKTVFYSEDYIAKLACNQSNEGAKHLFFNIQVTANVTLHSRSLQKVAISRYCYFSCDIKNPGTPWCLNQPELIV